MRTTRLLFRSAIKPRDLGLLRLGLSGAFLAILTVLLAQGGCSNDSGPPPAPGDTTAPGAITDLSVADSTCTSLTLEWTAPAEDGAAGAAVTSYDVRYRIGGIDSVPWDSLTHVTGEPFPQDPGARESFAVTGLTPGNTYAFAVRSIDDAGNVSATSNVATHGTSSGDCIPPGAVGDLAPAYVTSTSATLTWTAPAEDGESGGRVARYDVRFTTGELDSGSWSAADTLAGEPAPGDPGTPESFTIDGLSPDTRYEFGVRSTDQAGNISPLSNVVTLRTPMVRDTIPPDPVNDLAIRDVNAWRARLGWTASGDDGRVGQARSYDIRMNVGGSLDWERATRLVDAPAPGEAGASESFMVGGLAPGVSFTFAMIVIDDAGNPSSLSNVLVVTAPPPTGRDFDDPRGLCLDAITGSLLVADHSGSIFRFNALGEKGLVASVHGANSVRSAGMGTWFAIGGTDGGSDGTIWRYSSLGSMPFRFHGELRDPRAMSLDVDASDVTVIEEGPPVSIKRYSRGGGVLVFPSVTDGEPAGVAVDDSGNVYFGVNRTNGSAVVRRFPAAGGAATPVADLGASVRIGDLTLDGTGGDLWVLDVANAAVIALSLDGSAADPIASGLRSPVAIAAIQDERFLAYVSADGFVLRALRAR